jgi:hypothetical protein
MCVFAAIHVVATISVLEAKGTPPSGCFGHSVIRLKDQLIVCGSAGSRRILGCNQSQTEHDASDRGVGNRCLLDISFSVLLYLTFLFCFVLFCFVFVRYMR